MKVFLWTPNYPICGTVDRLVSTTDDNRRQQKNAFSQAQGNALCGVPTEHAILALVANRARTIDIESAKFVLTM
jgi:hypothetical protein